MIVRVGVPRACLGVSGEWPRPRRRPRNRTFSSSRMRLQSWIYLAALCLVIRADSNDELDEQRTQVTSGVEGGSVPIKSGDWPILEVDGSMLNATLLRPVTVDEVAAFARDGVVMLPKMFSAGWIELLRRGFDKNVAQPTTRGRVWSRDEDGRTMFWDNRAWRSVTEYRQFIMSSPAAEIAGRIMGSSRVNFYFDAIFSRSPGTQFKTPWHQDEPYWSIEGHDTLTIWMPLVRVKRKNALAYVPGSHRSSAVLNMFDFGMFNADEKADVDRVNFTAIAEADVPDIDADPEKYGVVAWDMEPGDCVCFNSRILHGGSGHLNSGDGLRVFTTKWTGDDARIIFREQGMDPDHSEWMKGVGLKPGDRPAHPELYPELWTRGDGARDK